MVAEDLARSLAADVETAMDRLKKSGISWQRDSDFFAGSLLDIDPDTHKLTGSDCTVARASTRGSQVGGGDDHWLKFGRESATGKRLRALKAGLSRSRDRRSVPDRRSPAERSASRVRGLGR